MNIGIDIRSTLGQSTEIGKYTLGMLNGIANIDKENNYYLYYQKSLFSRKKKIPKIKAKNFKIVNDRFKRGIKKVMPNIDVFFSPTVNFMDSENIPMVININDLGFKLYARFYDNKYMESKDNSICRALDKADKIICSSEDIKRDLMKFYRKYDIANRLNVIYPTVDKEKFNVKINSGFIQKVFNRHGITIPYILSIFSKSKIKNSASVLKAFYDFKRKTNMSHILVMIGERISEDSKDKLAGDAKVDKCVFENVVFVENKLDKILADLYKGSEVFIFPPLYDGFGMPIIEAFACGIPVITSKTSACAEVAGKFAIKINSHDTSELTKALKNIVTDDILRKQLSKKSLERSKDFNCGIGAEKLLNVFREVKQATEV